MNKSFLFAVNVVVVFLLTFVIVFISSFAVIAIVDKQTWNLVKNEYLVKRSGVEKVASQDLGNIISGTVELTISKDFIEIGNENFDYKLTQEQKDNGFIDIKKNDDGSATYKIKKKEYKKYILDLKERAKQGLDEIAKQDDFSSIKSITYNDDLSKIVIVADKEKFEDSFDSMVIMSCGLTSCMYQMFDIDAKGKCTIEVKDGNSGKVFKTTVYPDAMQKE